MSTPSTATAVHPCPPYHQQPYHEQSYSQSSLYDTQQLTANRVARQPPFYDQYPQYAPPPAATSSSSDVRRVPVAAPPAQAAHSSHAAQSSHTQQPRARPHPQLPPPPSPSLPMAASSKVVEPKPGFYRKGKPADEDVITILSDSESEGQQHAPPSRAAAPKRATQADRKRKTQASTSYSQQAAHDSSLSNTHTPYTTQATSLGSQQSGGHYAPAAQAAAEASQATGQKRKRTRQTTQDEANQAKRRREIEGGRDNPYDPHDPFSLFHPPPKPPIRSMEVNVPLVVARHNVTHPVDEEDGHYIVRPHAQLTDDYRIVKQLGQGTFGKVVEAVNTRTNRKCAIKIIRSVGKYRDASKIELRVLSTLKLNDNDNFNRCIHLRDCFDFQNHICIVTDLYSQSVFDFLKANQFVPFPSSHIQKFAKQLFTSVAFLHDLNLVHTDLKPENILLVNNAYQTFTYNRTCPSSSTNTNRMAKHRKVLLDPEIRLIDFGSATFNDEYHSSVVSTRHYRAPEIILNLGWSYPCDIWSIGCILVEFFTGDALFQTHDNLEHLAMMKSVIGRDIDKELVRTVNKDNRSRKANAAREFFKPNLLLDYPNTQTNRASKKFVRAMKKLEETIPQNNDFNKQFLDLLKRIFVYDPVKRITAKDALQHPWFRQSFPDDGTEAHRIRVDRERRLRAQQLPAAA